MIEETESFVEDEVNANEGTSVIFSSEAATAFAIMDRKYIITETESEVTYLFNYILGGQMHGFLTSKEEFLERFASCVSSGFDPDTDLVQVCILAQQYQYFGELVEKVMIHKYGRENLEAHVKLLNTPDVVQVIDLRQVLSRTSIIVVPFFEEGKWHHMIGGDTKMTTVTFGPNKGFIWYKFRYGFPDEMMMDDRVILLISGRVFHGSVFVAHFATCGGEERDFADPNQYEIAADLSRNIGFLELSCIITKVDLEAQGGNSTVQANLNGGESIVTLTGFHPALAGSGTKYMLESFMSTDELRRALTEEEAHQLVNKALTRAYQKFIIQETEC